MSSGKHSARNNRNTLSIRPLYFTLSIFVMVGLALLTYFFQPSVSGLYRQTARKNLLTDLQNEIRAENRMPTESYWLFRERYSPGVMTANQDFVDYATTFRIHTVFDDTADQPNQVTELLYYNSPYLQSVDGVVSKNTHLRDVMESRHPSISFEIDEPTIVTASVTNPNTNQEEILIGFFASVEEMQAVNGFFDYVQSEQELLENKVWFNETRVVR